MAVPLPPVLTYRARMLLPEKEGTPEGEFWWRVFELEWTVLAFGRWCADIAEREIQWRFPPRARAGVTELGIEIVFQESPYSQTTVQEWLREHDSYKWELRQQSHRVREPGGNNPAQQETREEFVRVYQNKQNMSQLPNVPRVPLSSPAVNSTPIGVAPADEGGEEVIESRVILRAPVRLLQSGNTQPDGGSRVHSSGVPRISRGYGGWTTRAELPDSAYDRYDSSGAPVLAALVSPSLEQRFYEAFFQDLLQGNAHEFQRHDQRGPENILPLIEAVLLYAFGRLERRRQEMHRVRLEVDAEMAEAKKAKARAERAEMLVTVLTDELSHRAQTEPKTGKKRAR
jgi:hypothetical protein